MNECSEFQLDYAKRYDKMWNIIIENIRKLNDCREFQQDYTNRYDRMCNIITENL